MKTRYPLALALALAFLMNMAQAQASAEPEIASYSIDSTLKLSSDRKTRGVSDTFGGPGLELTVEAAHESGLVAQFQLGSVSRVNYPEGNRLNAMLALGWRGGDPEGWHYGLGAAREWFPGARVDEAPAGFDASFNPTGLVNTRFHTSYLIAELGWSYLTARYLHVVSQDFRGANTATVCGNYLLVKLPSGDLGPALDCYGSAMQHSRGSQLFDLDLSYPLNGQTKLVAHLGWQRVRNFRGLDTTDYRLGLEHQRWGLVWGVELAGAAVRNRDLFIAIDNDGTLRQMEKPKLILSVAKKF